MVAMPPVVNVDTAEFWENPYETLGQMRRKTPICFVPELNAVLLTRRDDIAACEKNIAVFSSMQPDGLMTRLMGENMMRKDGADHMKERKQMFPSVSPRTVRDVWKAHFEAHTAEILQQLRDRREIDLVHDFALPVSGHALRHMTGLTNLSAQEIDQTSQAMIDGVGNYAGDANVEQRCRQATAKLDSAIDEMIDHWSGSTENVSIVNVLARAGQPIESIRANVKLAISGGQNEPRDAIAGAAWALLTHPTQRAMVHNDKATWRQVFEEYARWISPIGMSPREIRQNFEWCGIKLEKGQRAFLMFSSGNRDEKHFDNPEHFDLTRDTAKAISFGAGPHFCAGAWASRTLISEVALPMLFKAFPSLKLKSEASFGGWAFRGPLEVRATLSP